MCQSACRTRLLSGRASLPSSIMVHSHRRPWRSAGILWSHVGRFPPRQTLRIWTKTGMDSSPRRCVCHRRTIRACATITSAKLCASEIGDVIAARSEGFANSCIALVCPCAAPHDFTTLLHVQEILSLMLSTDADAKPQRASTAMELADTDEDGFLSRSEYEALPVTSADGESLNAFSLGQLFAIYDTNRDGGISGQEMQSASDWDEYPEVFDHIAKLYGHAINLQPHQHKAPIYDLSPVEYGAFLRALEQTPARDGLSLEVFRWLDVDESGELEEREIKPLTTDTGVSVPLVLALADADKSGGLSQAEFERAFCGSRALFVRGISTRDLFGAFDENGDEAISPSEFNRMMRGMVDSVVHMLPDSIAAEAAALPGSNLSEEHLLALLFEDADTDASGTLDSREFKMFMP
mmetsp:Transcript_3282/g.9470  ORF Transcript_3282/g.9470 Transcript_3282/m.9470 type:complete len:409 (+) Transcript_3282:241-1467(+)